MTLTYTRLLNKVEKLSTEDLLDLHKRVVSLVRGRRDAESTSILAKLRVGQKCQIFLRGTWTDGKITAIRLKRIEVDVGFSKYDVKPTKEIFRLTNKRTSKARNASPSRPLSPQEKAWETRRKRARN